MDYSECPACGVEIKSNCKSCTNCGAVLASRCGKCGMEWQVPLGADSCPKCGEKIGELF